MSMFFSATYVLHAEGGAAIESHSLTTDDVLWLAKSLWGEAQGASEDSMSAVAHCMIQRWMRWPNAAQRDQLFPTFARFVRAFSEPVNPRKLATGTMAQRERRARIQAATWGEIPKQARWVARRFAEGRSPNPVPLAIDFAATGYLKSKKRPFDVDLEGNAYIFAESDSWPWRGSYVQRIVSSDPDSERPLPLDSSTGLDGDPAPEPEPAPMPEPEIEPDTIEKPKTAIGSWGALLAIAVAAGVLLWWR